MKNIKMGWWLVLLVAALAHLGGGQGMAMVIERLSFLSKLPSPPGASCGFPITKTHDIVFPSNQHPHHSTRALSPSRLVWENYCTKFRVRL